MKNMSQTTNSGEFMTLLQQASEKRCVLPFLQAYVSQTCWHLLADIVRAMVYWFDPAKRPAHPAKSSFLSGLLSSALSWIIQREMNALQTILRLLKLTDDYFVG